MLIWSPLVIQCLLWVIHYILKGASSVGIRCLTVPQEKNQKGHIVQNCIERFIEKKVLTSYNIKDHKHLSVKSQSHEFGKPIFGYKMRGDVTRNSSSLSVLSYLTSLGAQKPSSITMLLK